MNINKLSDNQLITVRRPSDSGLKLLTDKTFVGEHRLLASGTATHAGLLINNRVYPPGSLKPGADTMVNPSPIPVVTGHDSWACDDCRACGSVQKATYVDTSRKRKLDTVITKWDVSDPDKDALGHIRVVQAIEDQDVISRILDGRLNRQSVGFYSSAMFDSITGKDLMQLDYDDWPKHIREGKLGQEVDGELCYLITGKVMYHHIAFTDQPADVWAGISEWAKVPKEVEETKGNLSFLAQDSETGLAYDLCDEDASKHFKRPSWAVPVSISKSSKLEDFKGSKESSDVFTLTDNELKRYQDECNKIKVKISKDPEILSRIGVLYSLIDPKDSSQLNLLGNQITQGLTVGELVTFPSDSSDSVIIGSLSDSSNFVTITRSTWDALNSNTSVTDSHTGIETQSEDTNPPEKESNMLKELMDLLAKFGDAEKASLATVPEIKSLIDSAISEEAAKQTALLSGKDTEIESLKAQLSSAVDASTKLEEEIKLTLTDRLFDLKVELGSIKPAQIDSAEKVEAIKTTLRSKDRILLQTLVDELSGISPEKKETDHKKVITTDNSKKDSSSENKKGPKWLK